ncbi:MAG: hypothetical protein JWR19_607 [Pedosphaera sp.]|nr:hypothetical protein [Pedosphaera sp.]
MKLLSPTNSRCDGSGQCEGAFTLAETIITFAVFMLLMGGILYGYLFGLNLHQITRVKLGATDDARKAVIQLTDEIRSANRIKVGDGTLTNFNEAGTNALQLGNAIQIYPTNNTSIWIRYFYETNAASANYTKLLRSTDGINANPVMLGGITNIVPIFSSEDSYGNTLSNNFNNRVIGVTLQFYQIEYPIVKIGPGNYYDFYQLHTRITRRTLY